MTYRNVTDLYVKTGKIPGNLKLEFKICFKFFQNFY